MKRLSMTVVLAALFAGLVGCAQPLKPMQFNNRMAKANDRLATSAKNFYKAIEPLSQQRPADGSLASSYGEVKSALEAAKADFADVLPPQGSPPGVILMEKYRTFLQQQQTIFDNSITPIYNIANNQGLDAFGKWQQIQPLLQRASAEESRSSNDLRQAHQEFCKHHMFEAR
jgi:hypothetical protein